MHRILLIILVCILVFSMSVQAAVQLPNDVPQSITVSGKTLKINENIASTKGYAVYGTYSDVPNNQLKSGQYRYLGYDINGNPFSNIDFPNDADSGRNPWEKEWIQFPWDEGLCKKSINNEKSNAVAWLDTLKWTGWTGSKLVDYLNIQSAPIGYASGSVAGWHISNNKTWYQTFDLEPEKTIEIPNLSFNADFGVINQDYQVWFNDSEVHKKYVHQKQSAGQVTFRIYKYSYSLKNGLSMEARAANAVLCKETTVNFGDGGGKWEIPLKVERPPVDYENGFYITTSESNFDKGIIIAFIYQGNDFGVHHDTEYKPDSSTIGNFAPCEEYEWKNSSDKLKASTP